MRGRSLLYCGLAVVLLVVVLLAAWVLSPAPLRAKTLSTREPAVATSGTGPAVVATSTGPGLPELRPDMMDPAPADAPQPTAPAGTTTTPAVKPTAPAEKTTTAPTTPTGPTTTAPVPPAVDPTAPRPTWPRPIAGRILDAERKPLARASVVLNGVEHFTDAEGAFNLDVPPSDAAMIVKLPGFERKTVVPTKGPLEITLKPQAIKAAYLTYFGIGDKGIRSRVLDLVARTELNAVVIDVKGDRGWIPYRTEVPLALAAGAQGPVMLPIESMLADFKARGIYTIARVVTFKDNMLAQHRPDLAIIDTRTGKPWIDNEKLAWVDPFREEVWAYNVAIAREAVRKGFDEVQFDYVRFPTDGRLSAARYSKPNSKETRMPAIAGFLEQARREIGAMGAFVAADVFGYTAFNENDTDIGQRIEELAPHLDYLCPMVYPSGYHVGIPGVRNPMTNPYQIVFESVRLTRKRSGQSPVRVRPWLQDFKDYAFDRRIFGVTEVRAQIKGSDAAGGVGWMLWNPKNDYTGAALAAEDAYAAK